MNPNDSKTKYCRDLEGAERVVVVLLQILSVAAMDAELSDESPPSATSQQVRTGTPRLLLSIILIIPTHTGQLVLES